MQKNMIIVHPATPMTEHCLGKNGIYLSEYTINKSSLLFGLQWAIYLTLKIKISKVCAKFYRITQTNMKSTFFSSLDEYMSKMFTLYRSRGGVYGDEMKTLLDQLDQDTDPEDTHTKGMKMGILTVIEDDVATIHSNPIVRCMSVVLEEQVVLDNVQDLPTAVALLFGLIYALNMSYPKEIKYTFKTIQKLLIGLTLNALQESSSSKTNC
ncbi:hypothetical protein QTP86_020020 [Hemibagrus guttatus]|nr:hypothetical protein QTP86_020020 [Hemibagrus guttatus]